MRVYARMWERFKPAWAAWILVPAVTLVLLGVKEWSDKGENERAWDKVTADDRKYLIVFVAILVGLLVWHFVRSWRDLFAAHRERGREADRLEGERDEALADAARASQRQVTYQGGTHIHIGEDRPDLADTRAVLDALQELGGREAAPAPAADPPAGRPPIPAPPPPAPPDATGTDERDPGRDGPDEPAA
jgi:hypothetical protein